MAQKTPKWHTKNREHVWERYYFLYDFFKERILLVFVHNNLGKTGVLFEKLFSVCFCLLRNYSAKHNTRFPKKYFTEFFSKKICQNFSFFMTYFWFLEKKISLAVQRGQRQGSD